MRLYDLANVVRSKNAGPFTVTIDLLFRKQEDLARVAASPAFNRKAIAALYGISKSAVCISPFNRACAIKISMPRSGSSSGAPGDRDVYGSQQHFPLGDLDI